MRFLLGEGDEFDEDSALSFVEATELGGGGPSEGEGRGEGRWSSGAAESCGAVGTMLPTVSGATGGGSTACAVRKAARLGDSREPSSSWALEGRAMVLSKSEGGIAILEGRRASCDVDDVVGEGEPRLADSELREVWREASRSGVGGSEPERGGGEIGGSRTGASTGEMEGR